MSSGYFQNYIPVLILAAVVTLLAVVLMVLSYLLGPRHPSKVKMASYECGIEPTGDARQRFSVKFYLVAMVFILFDVEVIFLYPWAVIFHELRMYGFVEMLLFVGFVFPGFIYLWRKGVFDWSVTQEREWEEVDAATPSAGGPQ